jgi:hypothetical protein
MQPQQCSTRFLEGRFSQLLKRTLKIEFQNYKTVCFIVHVKCLFRVIATQTEIGQILFILFKINFKNIFSDYFDDVKNNF